MSIITQTPTQLAEFQSVHNSYFRTVPFPIDFDNARNRHLPNERLRVLVRTVLQRESDA